MGCRAWTQGASTNHPCLLPLASAEYPQCVQGTYSVQEPLSPDLRQADQDRHGHLWEHRGWGSLRPSQQRSPGKPARAWGRSDPLPPPQPPASCLPARSALSRRRGLPTRAQDAFPAAHLAPWRSGLRVGRPLTVAEQRWGLSCVFWGRDDRHGKSSGRQTMLDLTEER